MNISPTDNASQPGQELQPVRTQASTAVERAISPNELEIRHTPEDISATVRSRKRT